MIFDEIQNFPHNTIQISLLISQWNLTSHIKKGHRIESIQVYRQTFLNFLLSFIEKFSPFSLKINNRNHLLRILLFVESIQNGKSSIQVLRDFSILHINICFYLRWSNFHRAKKKGKTIKGFKCLLEGILLYSQLANVSGCSPKKIK